MRHSPWARSVLLVLGLLVLAAPPAFASGGGEDGVAAFAKDLSPLWVLPFAALLLAIAVLPLVAHHWWEHNRNKALVAAACAVVVLALLVHERDRGGLTALGHALAEYVSFIALLGALYVISGGILLTGDIRATPRVNATFLALGGVLANLIGTTGASMLLIRPVLRVNSERKRTLHTVVFFIFIVSNVGGCLTPLGDPPLFLGFLEGVPFTWTLGLAPEWVFLLAALLLVYLFFDTVQYGREDPQDILFDDTRVEPVRVHGLVNLLFLAGVMAAIVLPGALHLSPWWQVVGMVAMALLSLWATPSALREQNGFSYGPIVEVAVLFVGIFVAMVPALQILQARGSEFGLHAPWQFFFATGALSSFLDNAPTYLTFVSVAAGVHAAAPLPGPAIEMVRGAVPESLLAAISLGAVFMGAMTYIGNGPNFMVKAIAEQSGQRMPSFFGYLLWSVSILLPLLVVLVLLFMR